MHPDHDSACLRMLETIPEDELTSIATAARLNSMGIGRTHHLLDALVRRGSLERVMQTVSGQLRYFYLRKRGTVKRAPQSDSGSSPASGQPPGVANRS